mgnify:FL=1
MKVKLCVILAVIICLTGCGTKAPKTASSVGNINFVASNVSDVSFIMDQTKTAAIQKAEEVAEQIRVEQEQKNPRKGYLIAIDAGHQAQGNSEKEPIGPGATESKAKVAGGTRGVVTGIPEYELTLQVSLKLRDALEEKGYQVLMIRETNDVNISNAERATVANEAGVNAFIRIHADGSESSSAAGMMTICQTPSNPYNGELYQQSRALADYILNQTAAATGGVKRNVWETDTMSGINWAKVPTTILEMGFMTNPSEDQQMASEDYQMKIVEGIVKGMDAFFGIEE